MKYNSQAAVKNEVSTTTQSHAKIYRAGTLRYTIRGLLVLFLWLLWGDFAFTFFENIFVRFMPLYLKDMHSSNALIGIMTGSFAGLVNVFFLPNISQWSDHYRSPLGRRIPFLYVVTPLAVAFLIAIGFAPEIGSWIHSRLLVHFFPTLSKTTVILTLLCALGVSFHFFNMILVNAYNWLLRDVVPQELMARFLSWFRLVGTVSSFAFLWYVFPHVITRRKEVFLGVGIFYLIAFLLMCRNVKEGEYGAPPSRAERPGMLHSFAIYFRECLCIPLYRNFFITCVLVILATNCAGPFSILFMRETLELTMDDMGKVFAWGAAASALAYFPMGWLCDRFTSISVMLLSLIVLVMISTMACFLVDSKVSLLIYTAFMAVPLVGWGLGSLATTMKLFPDEKFGQFSSALNVFGCGALILGNYLIGQFMDLVLSNYRMTFFWSAVFFALAIYPGLLVYRGWKSHGGPLDYVAPLPPPVRDTSRCKI